MERIAVIGGTGPQGKGLALRFAASGHEVVIGSRSEDRAAETAAELSQELPEHGAGLLTGATNSAAAEMASIVVLAIPHAGSEDLLAALEPALRGTIVISCANPLKFDERGPYGLDLGGDSAAEQAQRVLPGARVIGAFHHVAAANLIRLSTVSLEHEDVLVCGDDEDAKTVVRELATAVTGKPGIDVGPLRMARQLEPLTAVLISVNRNYRVRSGIALTGVGV